MYSAYEIFMASSLQWLLKDTGTLEKRCLLGLLAEKMFNDPFRLCGTRGYVPVSDVKTLGYCFIAPMLSCFCKWLEQRLKDDRIEKMLFPSRDGCLTKRVFDLLSDGAVETVYFRTSRRSVAMAAVKTRADIHKILERKYTGSLRSLLWDRFGLSLTEEGEAQDLAPFEAQILERAALEREQYLKYLERTAGLNGKKLGLFDCVAGGTVQFYLEKLLSMELNGYYFATMNLPNDFYKADSPRIKTAYGNITSYHSQGALARHYLLLESVLGDGKPAFLCIDEQGNEFYDTANPVEHHDAISLLQDGALEFARGMKEFFPFAGDWENCLGLAEEIFGTLFESSVKVDPAIKEIFVNDDGYDGIGNYQVWQ